MSTPILNAKTYNEGKVSFVGSDRQIKTHSKAGAALRNLFNKIIGKEPAAIKTQLKVENGDLSSYHTVYLDRKESEEYLNHTYRLTSELKDMKLDFSDKTDDQLIHHINNINAKAQKEFSISNYPHGELSAHHIEKES